jgi:hypothetical protein
MDLDPYVVFVALVAAAAFMAYRGQIALGLLIIGWFASVANAIAVYEMTSSMERALLAAAALFLPSLAVAVEIHKGRESVFVHHPQWGALAAGSCLLVTSLGFRFAAGFPVLNWSQGVIVLATIVAFLVASIEKRKS